MFDARVRECGLKWPLVLPVSFGLSEVTHGVSDITWGLFHTLLLASAAASRGRLALCPAVGEVMGPLRALPDEGRDFPPPHHHTAAHSRCGSPLPVFNLSPLTPAIITMVIIIYGVLTEGLATQ